jgi:hypothetical protein
VVLAFKSSASHLVAAAVMPAVSFSAAGFAVAGKPNRPLHRLVLNAASM